MITALDSRDDGLLFFGLRGKSKGLWLAMPGGTVRELLPDIEPWAILVEGRNIWVGTIDDGLWGAEGSTEFKQYSTGSVTALEKVGTRIWVGYSDGRIVDALSQEEKAVISGGFASKIASLGRERALLTVDSPSRQAAPFQQIAFGQLMEITDLKIDDDAGLIGATGAWSLGDGTAMVGTFRRGPLRWGGQLQTARTGFQAMVSGGAAIDSNGQLVLAFMGTGVYIRKEGILRPHLMDGPVTDSIVVRSVLGQVVVLDFDGIKLLEADGSWSSGIGLEDPRQRIKNSLRDIGRTEDGAWWALDHYGALWTREAEEEWRQCSIRQGIRFDGDGSDLLVVTRMGYFQPVCDGWKAVHSRAKNTIESRAWGDVIAFNGALYQGEQKITDIPDGIVDALIRDGQGYLISVRNEALLRCETSCVEVAPAIPEPIIALGRLADQRIWALEENGSLLIDDDSDQVPAAWYQFTESRVQQGGFMQLSSNPWLRNQAGFSSPRFLLPPRMRLDYWWFFFLLELSLAGFVWMGRRKEEKISC